MLYFRYDSFISNEARMDLSIDFFFNFKPKTLDILKNASGSGDLLSCNLYNYRLGIDDRDFHSLVALYLRSIVPRCRLPSGCCCHREVRGVTIF